MSKLAHQNKRRAWRVAAAAFVIAVFAGAARAHADDAAPADPESTADLAPPPGESVPAADAPAVVEDAAPPVLDDVTHDPQVVIEHVPHDVHVEGHAHAAHDKCHHARLSDEVLPLARLPCRPHALFEVGDPFMKPGRLQRGIKLPTCAVWQPSLLVFGTFRTALAGLSRERDEKVEWANRFDLFANLKLSATERILVGINPLDRDGRFTGAEFHPDRRFVDATNVYVHTAFFEGDFGEIFPTLDRSDRIPLDIGFSVGRQPIVIQDGILVADRLDVVGITQNSKRPSGMSNLQITALFAWANVNRGPTNSDDRTAQLFALLAEGDFPKRTVEFSLVGIDATPTRGDGVFVGLGSTQRLGKINSTIRANASIPLEDETDDMRLGGLLTGEFSFTPVETNDNVYANAFVGIDDFSFASRQEGTGGPVGRTGILFARSGIGSIGSPLSNRARHAVGAAVGWQRFFQGGKQQLLFEIGGRGSTNDTSPAAFGAAARYQTAVGCRSLAVIDVYVGWEEDEEAFVGGRFEFLTEF